MNRTKVPLGKMMRDALQEILKHKILRYIAISIFGYTLLSFLMFLFVKVFKIPQTLSFGISYFLLLLIDYISNRNFVFEAKQKRGMVIKYFIYICFFQILNMVIYNLLTKLNINYLLCSYITMLSLFPMKFFASKKFVFK